MSEDTLNVDWITRAVRQISEERAALQARIQAMEQALRGIEQELEDTERWLPVPDGECNQPTDKSGGLCPWRY